MSDTAVARHRTAVLRASQGRLRSLTEPLDAEALRSPSYAARWSIAQVLSHLGSQAEIMDRYLAAALGAGDPPGRDDFPAIWQTWDERAPEEQRAASLATNDAHIGRLESLSDDELGAVHLSLFGVFELDGAGFARLRLGEHAVHSWDIAVALDPTAVVAPDSVSLLVDAVPELAGLVGKPQGKVVRLRVETTEPDRSFALVVDDAVALTESPGAPTAGVLRLPAEALLRLVYGRLDPDHAPPLELDAPGLTVDDLRAVFPGF